MNIPPKYEDLVFQLNELNKREAALREELAALRESYEAMRDRKNSIVSLQQRLAVAEQRADDMVYALARIQGRAEMFIDDGMHMPTPSIEAIRDIAAKAALKPAAEQTKICPNCKVCMGSPDFPENCLINGVKP